MKQIIRNRYLKSFVFPSLKEATMFLNKQGTRNVLSLDETFGDNHFCYVCFHSLTSEKQFVLSFSSDENEECLNFLFWDKHKLFVLDTGKYIYLISDSLNVVASFEVTTPLIGLYLINDDSLLILEEAFLRLANSEGKILKSELFDSIIDFSIKNGRLSIQTSEEDKSFKLA